MYCAASLPIILTFPLAFYLHSRTCIENLFPVETADIRRTFPEEAENLGLHIEVNFKEDKRVNIVDMAYEVFSGCRNISSNSHSYFEIFQEDLVICLLSNALLTILLSFIVQNSLLGIFIKIIAYRTKQAILLVPSIPYLLHKKLTGKILVPVSDSECSDDEFVDCVSTDKSEIDREESLPKANQSDEKHIGLTLFPIVSETSFLKSLNTGDNKCGRLTVKMSNFENCGYIDEDSIVFDVREQRTNGLTTSTPRDKVAPIQFEEASLDCSTNNEAAPKKFKRFLHEKNDEISRLGISFDSFDEDGYFKEFEDVPQVEESTNEGNVTNGSYFQNMNSSMRRNFNLLF